MKNEHIRHILVTDFTLDVSIGVNPEEKLAKQRLIISLDIAVHESEQDINDNIDNVVCYDAIISNIKTMFEKEGHIELLETVAENIAKICLQNNQVLSAVVRVEKPDIYDDVARVGIEIFRDNKN